MTESDFKSVKQIAAGTPLSEKSIRKWAREGRFPVYRPGRKILIKASDFERFMQASRVRNEDNQVVLGVLRDLLSTPRKPKRQ